jgi:hypothetical protein
MVDLSITGAVLPSSVARELVVNIKRRSIT